MFKSIWKKGRNEGPEAPPHLELGDPYTVGADGDRDFVLHWFLRKRRGESYPRTVDCAPIREGDRRARGIAGDFDSVAFDASDAKGIGDSWARTRRHVSLVFGRAGGGETANRFLLGPKGVA